MNELRVFNNPEFGQVRMVEFDGKPFAVGNDVANALEYARPHEAVTAHCKGAVSYSLPTNGGVHACKEARCGLRPKPARKMAVIFFVLFCHVLT